jgi:type IV fimbrial biogenesis protein FimT
MYLLCRFQSQTTSTSRRLSTGVTLIELLVTVTVLSIILAIGIPSLREMQVRSQVQSISTEFANDIARARTEAITRNTCVAMCLSANTANALTGGTPTCATSGTNWQSGWIIFANPTCSGAVNNPTASSSTLISVRQAGSTDFQLAASNSTRRFSFEARGLMYTTNYTNMTLSYLPESVSSPHYRSLCISSAGRVTVKQYAGSSAC